MDNILYGLSSWIISRYDYPVDTHVDSRYSTEVGEVAVWERWRGRFGLFVLEYLWNIWVAFIYRWMDWMDGWTDRLRLQQNILNGAQNMVFNATEWKVKDGQLEVPLVTYTGGEAERLTAEY